MAQVEDTYDTLISRLEPLLRIGDAVGCERLIMDRLSGMSESPFHIVAGLSFQNTPFAIAKDLDTFYSRQSKRYTVGSLYIELNAFQTNTRSWYYEKFAYRKYGGRADDFGWLSRWDGESSANQLWGMYKLQRVYASKAGKASDQFEAFLVAGLLVQARFWRLLADSVLLLKKVKVPLLVSAHDTGLILELHPDAEPGAAADPAS
jgi:hypothetical protein